VEKNQATPKCYNGWCQPTASDYKGDWLAFAKDVPVPFHTSGWFNEDNKKDEAWILFDSNRQKWGIFIFLQQDNGQHQIIKLSESTFADLLPQFINISTVEPGEYDTACGKGYWECSEGEPAKVVLRTSGLVNSPYESGGASLIYWQNGRFEEVPLND
jgi:hypothetical protein